MEGEGRIYRVMGNARRNLGLSHLSFNLTKQGRVVLTACLESNCLCLEGNEAEERETKSSLLVVTPERMARHSHYVKLHVRRESSSSSLKDNFNYLDSLIPSVFFLCFYHRSYSYAEFITQYLLRVLRLQNKNRQLRHRIQSIYQPSDCNMTGQNSEHESIEYLPALDMIDLLSI